MRLLTVLLYLPGRKLAQRYVLPLALGGGVALHHHGTAKADSVTATTEHAGSKPSAASSGPHAAAADQPGGGILSRLLGGNEFANGGLTLMVVGAAAAGARVVLGSALRYCKRHVMVQAEIDSRDDCYRWVMHWLSTHPRFSKATNVSVTTNLTGTFGTSIPNNAAASAGGAGPPVTFLPAPGDHLLRVRGRWVLVSRQRSAGNPQLAANARLLMETLRISMLGTSRGPLEELIAEAAASYKSQSCRTAVHSVDQDGYWTQVGSRPVRPLHTVVLPDGQAESLLADCEEFLASESWYAHHGIPFRRGYLLWGPPGTGKTSTAMALAGALGLEIYVVTLSSPTMTDETLRHLLNTAGTRSILLLEDVDAAFVASDRSASQGTARLTFSGLLNAIDGVAAQEGRLLFMTTNHIERLNKALIRPGRVDVRCFLGPCNSQQARAMFLSFYRDLPRQLALRAPQEGGSGAGPDAPLQPPSPPTSSSLQKQQQPAISAGPQAGAAGSEPQLLGAGGKSLSLLRCQQPAAGGAEWVVGDDDAALLALADEFASKLPAQPGFSTAQLQAYLMSHRLQPEAALAGLAEWLADLEQQQQQQQQAVGAAQGQDANEDSQ